MTRKIYFPFFLAGALAFAGCHSSVTSPNSGGNAISPGLGSSFSIENQVTDPNGTVEPPDTITDVFDAVGVSIYGKSSASEVIESEGGYSLDTIYYNYESNGDISVYPYGNDAYPGIENWIVFPFSSQQPTSVSGSTNQNGGIVQTIINVVGAGQGTCTVLGKSYSTEKVTMTTKTITESSSDTTITMRTYSFVPQLGYWTDAISNDLGYSNHYFLINYTLK